MSNKFETALNNTMNNEVSITENGAIGYKTSGQKLLDLNFKTSSLRNMTDEAIRDEFVKAYYDSPVYATKWLFFLRDREKGMGERRSFRVMFNWLASNAPDIAERVLAFIPEFGRWDDLVGVLSVVDNGAVKNRIIDVIQEQLAKDIQNVNSGKSVSLLAKWLPSENTSSSKTRLLAHEVRTQLGMDSRSYRKTLSKLRKAMNVIEIDMSAKNWSAIDYNAVPSKANLKYKNAFLRNDEARRREWLGKLERGDSDAKINSSVNFPCDIVHQYMNTGWRVSAEDSALEAMWKALPDFVSGNDSGDTIVVADGSGSMTTTVGNGRMTALDVANSLAIYFSEKLKGAFANKYITFSDRPQYVDMKNCKTLRDKIHQALNYNEVASTNIEAVFKLILDTAIKSGCTQEDLPKNILVVSDMEFNYGVSIGRSRSWNSRFDSISYDANTMSLFDNIKKSFEKAGYQMPRVVYWNVCGRTGTIPLTTNELGVALVSGFSPAIAKMIFSAKTDPWECLIETLDSERYAKIGEALKVK